MTNTTATLDTIAASLVAARDALHTEALQVEEALIAAEAEHGRDSMTVTVLNARADKIAGRRNKVTQALVLVTDAANMV